MAISTAPNVTGTDEWRDETTDERWLALAQDTPTDLAAPETWGGGCECWVTPESEWFHYGSAVEPGSQVEFNPDCPKHRRPAPVAAAPTGETEFDERLDPLAEAIAAAMSGPDGATGYEIARAVEAAGWRLAPSVPTELEQDDRLHAAADAAHAAAGDGR